MIPHSSVPVQPKPANDKPSVFSPVVVAFALVSFAATAQAQNYVNHTAQATNLRTGPAATYQVQAVVAACQSVTVTAQAGDWRQITVGNQSGWVFSGNLSNQPCQVQANTSANTNGRAHSLYSSDITGISSAF